MKIVFIALLVGSLIAIGAWAIFFDRKAEVDKTAQLVNPVLPVPDKLDVSKTKFCEDWEISPFAQAPNCIQRANQPTQTPVAKTSEAENLAPLRQNVQQAIDAIEAKPDVVHREYATYMQTCYKTKEPTEEIKSGCELLMQHRGRWHLSLRKAANKGSEEASLLLGEDLQRLVIYGK